jgi:hypothetical protein
MVSKSAGEGGAMTDEEYLHFLTALAGKHLRNPLRVDLIEPRFVLDRVSGTSHFLKAVMHHDDPALLNGLINALEGLSFRDVEYSPVNITVTYMETSGILDALDDAPDLVLGELRRSSIPREDEAFLRSAGFDTNDIEVLLTLAVHRAHALALSGKLPSDIAEEATKALPTALQALRPPPTQEDPLPPRKKRKILNGIGKLLGGAAAGIGNVALVASTLTAPNPATGAAAIASGGVAVSSFFAGLGDLRGE